jgi:chemotaxis protein histidine kinase CheA
LEAFVTSSHFDAASVLAREERARLQLQNKLTAEMKARCAAEERIKEAAKHARTAKRAADREASDAAAKTLRLSSLVAASHFEAACAAGREEKAHQHIEHMQSEVAELQAKNEHLRFLKAQMALQKRNALAKASSAVSLEADLQKTRKHCRELRAQVNASRVQMNLTSEMSEPESEVVSDTDSDAADGTPQVSSAAHAPAAASEADASAAVQAREALQCVNAMPTWRAVHGPGRGAAKLEWGTRLTIYQLLSMLVPPSAVGSAIVAVVKRTAPWLNPAAPTYMTVLRCRFELRFVEEALSARRIASAHRIRGIGFDETTKFGNTSLTSNVTIEPTEGAPLEDVIARAAYCPLGGTAAKLVQSIEGRQVLCAPS